MIDALIFDFDGVILDTETPEYETWQDVYRSYGVELDRSIWSRVIGGGTDQFDPYDHLEELVGARLDRAAVQRSRRRRYSSIVEASSLLPGVLDYIDEANRLGLKLGVASSSSRDWVEGHLVERGLLPHFRCVVTQEDVASVKPDPALYLVAMEQLGTSPGRALAIEDSFNGLTAAKRAGMLCVAVPNPMTQGMDFSAADLRLSALSDLELRALIDRLGGQKIPS